MPPAVDPRSAFYHEPAGETEQNLGLMQLMHLMPMDQKPNISKPRKGHKTYPYLLAGLRVDCPGQALCADISDLPMQRGFLYLVAIMEWFTQAAGLAHLAYSGG